MILLIISKGKLNGKLFVDMINSRIELTPRLSLCVVCKFNPLPGLNFIRVGLDLHFRLNWIQLIVRHNVSLKGQSTLRKYFLNM